MDRVIGGLAQTILELAAANHQQTMSKPLIPPTNGYTIAHNDAGLAVVIGSMMKD